MSLPVIEQSEIKTLEHEASVDDLTDLFPFEEPTDPNARAHIVNPPMNIHIWKPGMETKEIVDIARMTGQEITALCGYTWVPKHNPDKLDVCEKCMKIAEHLMSENGE